jgi:hypothetical protein
MKVTESILLETDPFEPANMPEIVSQVFDIIHQSEAVGYEVTKSSLKTDTPQWQFAVLMRRKPASPEEWLLTLEAIAHEAPF